MKELELIKYNGCIFALFLPLSFHLCTLTNHLQEPNSWYKVAVGDGTPRLLNGVQAHFPLRGSSIASKKGKKRPEINSDTPVSFDNQRHELLKKQRTGSASELHKEVPNPKPLLPVDDYYRSSLTPDSMGYSAPPKQWEGFYTPPEFFTQTIAVTDGLKVPADSELNYSPYGKNGLTFEEEDIGKILLSLNQFRASELIKWGKKNSRYCIGKTENSVSVLQTHKSAIGTSEMKDLGSPQIKMDLKSQINQRPKKCQRDLVIDNFLNVNGFSLGRRGKVETSHKDLLYAFISTLPLAEKAQETRHAQVVRHSTCMIESSLRKSGEVDSLDPKIIPEIIGLRDHMLLLNSWTLNFLKDKEHFYIFQAEDRALERAINHLFSHDQVKRALLDRDSKNYEKILMLRMLRKLIFRTEGGNGASISFEFRRRYRSTCVSENDIMRTELSLTFIKSYYQTINSAKWEAVFEDDEGYLCSMVAFAHKLATNDQFRCHDTFKLLKTFLPWGAKLTDEQKETVAAANKPWLRFSPYMNLDWLKGHLIQPKQESFLSSDGP
ncbi:hypothetical protein O181_060205 [Austropuccinia psidii MF-1]|uniref:Uncharacterized protein n=1 Tax=Austropuccinia psidii MF-1 TaxID=1389203 RepID=A0A9Q3EK05_9BASI|nr:hypothetical protein [Austropuccinia psidii MF-1]